MLFDPFVRCRFGFEVGVGFHSANRKSRLAPGYRVLVGIERVTIGDLNSKTFCQAMADLGLEVVFRHDGIRGWDKAQPGSNDL